MRAELESRSALLHELCALRDALQTAWSGTSPVHAAVLEMLGTHRVQMRRSRALLARSRALCHPRRLAPAPAPAPAADAASGIVRCAFSGCPHPPRFQPCFVFGFANRRVLVRDLPARVCAEHRTDVAALFRRPSVLEALRRRLVRAGPGAPGAVRVLFEVEDGVGVGLRAGP